MKLDLKGLRQHAVRPSEPAEQAAPKQSTEPRPGPEGESHLRADPTLVTEVAASSATPPPVPAVAPEPTDEVADIESALADDTGEDEAVDPAAIDAPATGWSKSALSPAEQIKESRTLPGKAQGRNYAAGILVETPRHFSYKPRVWDSRDSFFSDFYSDPLEWPEEMVTLIQRLYLDGMPLVQILHVISRPRKRGNDLPLFTSNRLGPLRIIDVYAMLYTCTLIPLGHSFFGDERYLKFSMHKMREAVVDEADAKNSELPLPLFVEAYARWARKGAYGFKAVADELLQEYKQLRPVQLYYTLQLQLGKAIKRRLGAMRAMMPDQVDPAAAGKALLESARRSGLAFTHGERTYCIVEFPPEKTTPVSMLPSKTAAPLSYLLDAMPALEELLGQPARDVLKDLRDQVLAFYAAGKPVRTQPNQ